MKSAARFFQALGDETRLALLVKLRQGEQTVGDLVTALGCPQPKVSRHLKVLRDAGLVHNRRDGRNVLYELATAARWGKDARGWIELLDLGLPLPEAPESERGSEPPTPSTMQVEQSKSHENPASQQPAESQKAPEEDIDTFLL